MGGLIEPWLLWWLETIPCSSKVGFFLFSLKFFHFPKHVRFLLWKNTQDKQKKEKIISALVLVMVTYFTASGPVVK